MTDVIALAAPPAADLFAQAVREDSNLELDWLWLFTQLTRECEQRIALERVLQINPGNEIARRELARLFAEQGVPAGLGAGGAIPRVDGGGFQVAAGATTDAVGAQVAQTVYGGLARAAQPQQAGF